MFGTGGADIAPTSHVAAPFGDRSLVTSGLEIGPVASPHVGGPGDELRGT